MKVVTADEMRKIDTRATKELGILGVVLMENAGRCVVTETERRYGCLEGKRLCIVSGKGNNGGDGFVVARHATNRGAAVSVFIVGEKDDIKGDARINLEILLRSGIPVSELRDKKELRELRRILSTCNIVIDALLGTGLSSSVKGLHKEVIDAINSSAKPVVSVDIPSGISSDTGEILGNAVVADMTVTAGLPKRGLLLYPGAKNAGVVKIADIGIPKSFLNNDSIKTNLITLEQVKKMIPRREPDVHKGSIGHLLVIAGSVGKTGAACMTAMASLRVGTGLVTLASPASVNDILETKLTEIMTLPLPETDDQTISPYALEEIERILPKMSTIAIGPGLSMNRETLSFIRDVVGESTVPVIIDADGVNAFAGNLEALKGLRSKVVFTPHPGEMARLLGITAKEVQRNRIEVVQSFATAHRVHIALKGARTVISDPGGNVYINPTGNPGMATGGTGDILTGMIAGFVAQGMELLSSIILGVYLHGLAGDMAAMEYTEMGLIATDLIEKIPEAIKVVRGKD
ncbi:MAG: NAD(P)H-hydrate dehydratase [Nitrospirota bacterium]